MDESVKIIDFPCYGLDAQDFVSSNTQSVNDKGLEVGLFENHKRRVKPLNLT